MNQGIEGIPFSAAEYHHIRQALLEQFNGDNLAVDVLVSKYLKHDDNHLYETTIEAMCHRHTAEFFRIEQKFGGENALTYDSIYDLLYGFKKLVLGGSPLSGIGIGGYTSMSNCYVIGNTEDSYGAILKTDEEQVQLMKRRGGCGHDLSHLRYAGAKVRNSALTSSGVVSFMHRYSNSTREVAQDGRRGALMLTLSITHPDADKFIDSKLVGNAINGANISIKLTDDFMNAVESKSTFRQFFDSKPNPEINTEKYVDAHSLFDKLINNVWQSAEPGVLFWDRVLEMSNARPYGKEYTESSTNPCLTGDTMVMLADGRNALTIKELADIGDDVDVYCYDNDNNVVIRTMRHPRVTGHQQQIYKVTLDSGDTVRCTANHKIKLTNGSYKEAKDLIYGDSIAVISRQQMSFDEALNCKSNSKSQNYSVICNDKKQEFEHRLIASHYYDFTSDKTVVHHIDHNALNNCKSNLIVLSKKEHDTIHANERMGMHNPIYKIKANSDRFAEYSAKMSESTTGEKNGRYNKNVELNNIVDYVIDICTKLNRCISKKELESYCRYADNNIAWSAHRYNQLIDTFGSIRQFIIHCATLANVKYPTLYHNDSRVLQTAIKMLDNGYDIKIIDNDVYVKRICEHCGNSFFAHQYYREVSFCSEVCAANNNANKFEHQQMLAFTAAKQKLKKQPNWHEFVNECNEQNIDSSIKCNYSEFKQVANQYNHRVQSVELDGFEDVYNGTVDDYHNFFIGNFDSLNKFNKKSNIFINNKQCGEQPLPPYASCILLHRNLATYVKNPFCSTAYFDFPSFYEDTFKCVRLCDDLVELEIEAVDRIISKIALDVESDITKRTELELWQKVKSKLKATRRFGMGFMALGDVLAMLGLTYGTEKANDFSEEIQKSLTKASYEGSIQLAKERGAFEIFDFVKDYESKFVRHIYDNLLSGDYMRMYNNHGRRNICCNTIAPTGTTALLTQTTSGIEPVFMPLHKRRRRPTDVDNPDDINFVDEITGDKFIEYVVVHCPLMQWIATRVEPTNTNDNGFNIVDANCAANLDMSLCSKIKDWLLSLNTEQLTALMQASPYYKATTEDVDWLGKVQLQGALQKWIDSSISVTVNVPNNATKELIHNIYMTAWKTGCKGCTVYRDGCRAGVLVSIDDKDKDKNKQKQHILANGKKSKRKAILPANIYAMKIRSQYWCILIGVDDGKPYEVFAFDVTEQEFNKLKNVEDTTITKTAKKHYSLGDNCNFLKSYQNIIERFGSDEQQTITRLYSTMLRNDMELCEIVDQTEKSSASMSTFCKAIGRALKTFIAEGSKLYAKCQKCGGDIVKYDGCTRCTQCGDSKCQ